MQTINLASALFSETRLRVLKELVLTGNKHLHLREIARRCALSVSGTRSELKNLESAAIVLVEKLGNQHHYRLNPQCPLFHEINMLIIKTVGVSNEISKNLKPIQGIDFAYIFGSFASGTYDESSDVDLMVVGNVDPQKIVGQLLDMEKLLAREINIRVYSLDEYHAELKLKGSFISRVHDGTKILVIGEINAI